MDLYLFSNLFAASLPVVLLFWGITYVLMTKLGRVEVRTTIALVHFVATTAVLAFVAWPIRGKAYDAGIQLLVPLVLSIISCAILYFQEQRYQKSKQPAVVSSAETCVAVQKEQPVPIQSRVTATQPVQQINKTVVASVVAGVVTVAGCFYLFLVVSANQAYEKAVTEHDQAVAAYEKKYGEPVEKSGEPRPNTYEATQAWMYKDMDREKMEDALKKAEMVKRYPLASLFKKEDVE